MVYIWGGEACKGAIEEGEGMRLIRFVVVFLLLMTFLKGSEWKTVGVERVISNSSRAWDLAEEYCPQNMDIRDYCDRVVALNGHINSGELVYIPVCEVGK